MKENQYATAYRMLPRRRKVASFNVKVETQNEQASLPEGDANQNCWRYEGVPRKVERKRGQRKRRNTPIEIVSPKIAGLQPGRRSRKGVARKCPNRHHGLIGGSRRDNQKVP
jgi:hypothetical protein